MARSSRVRPRPSSWHIGSLRVVLSALVVARIGERMVADAFTVPSSDTRANGRVWARAGYCATDESTSPAIRINSANIISTCQPSRQERSRTNTGGAGVSAAATATRIARDVAILARSKHDRSRIQIANDQAARMTEVLPGMGAKAARTVDKEAVLVKEVKTLADFLKTRVRLEKTLGRNPTAQEWASALSIPSDELVRQVETSHHAQEQLVACHVWLIVMMARKHYPRMFDQGLPGVTREDMIQEGRIALLRAAETFDPNLGFRFATYAGWWVRDGLQRCHMRQSRLIRLPQHVHTFLRETAKSDALLQKELGRPPTNDELATHMGVTVTRLRRLTSCKDAFSLEAAPRAGGSLSRPNGKGRGGLGSSSGGPGAKSEEGYQHETLASLGISPEKKAEACLFRKELDDLMANLLSPDERLVVTMRYGLGGASPTTLSELAQKAGASKYIMRKMETRALNKLRRPELSQLRNRVI